MRRCSLYPAFFYDFHRSIHLRSGSRSGLCRASLGDVGDGFQRFDQSLRTRDPPVKQTILEYNGDAWKAMRAVLDRMKMMEVRGYGD